MTQSRERPRYEAPRSHDLSGMGVVGQLPLGECINGPTPYYNCAVGTGFVGSCNPGGTPDTSRCVGGTFHTSPACRSGVSAVTACLSGQGQNF